MGIHSRARPTIASLLISYGNGYEKEIPVERPKNIFLKFIQRFSSYKKMLRIMSYVLRFLDGVGERKISKSTYSNAKELKWPF